MKMVPTTREEADRWIDELLRRSTTARGPELVLELVAAARREAGTGCELVDCDRPEPHTHQIRCEHPNPGDGSCDNCRAYAAESGRPPR